MSSQAQPLGGPALGKVSKWILWLGIVGVVLILWRFGVGLGRSTGLNDGYPWGLWIAFDVVTGTALGLSLIHISEPTRQRRKSRMPSSA